MLERGALLKSRHYIFIIYEFIKFKYRILSLFRRTPWYSLASLVARCWRRKPSSEFALGLLSFFEMRRLIALVYPWNFPRKVAFCCFGLLCYACGYNTIGHLKKQATQCNCQVQHQFRISHIEVVVGSRKGLESKKYILIYQCTLANYPRNNCQDNCSRRSTLTSLSCFDTLACSLLTSLRLVTDCCYFLG